MATLLGMPVEHAALTTSCTVLFMSSVLCMVVHDARKPSHRRLMKTLGWMGWAVRLVYSAYLGFVHAPPDLARTHKAGTMHLGLICNALVDQVSALHELPGWLNIAVRSANALIVSAQFGRYFEVLPGMSWWQLLWRHVLVWALPQVFIFAPYQVLRKVQPAPATRQTPSCPPGKLVDSAVPAACSKDPAATPSADQPTSQGRAAGFRACAGENTCQAGAGLSSGSAAAARSGLPTPDHVVESEQKLPPAVAMHSTGLTHSGSSSAWGIAAGPLETSSSAGSTAGMINCSHLPPGWRALPPPVAASGQLPALLRRPGTHAASGRASAYDIMAGMRQTPYQSKLGPSHKACVKLCTDATCDSLPPDLQQALQDALRNITGPAIHITEMAVRPGCVMITLGLVEEKPPHLEASSPAAAALPGQQPLASQLAAALLPEARRLLQLCPEEEGGFAAEADGKHNTLEGDVPDLQRALLQVDGQFYEVAWCADSCTWQLRPVAAAWGPAPPTTALPSIEEETGLRGVLGGSNSASAASSSGSGSSVAASGDNGEHVHGQPWLGLACVVGMQPREDHAAAGPASPVSPARAAAAASSFAPAPAEAPAMWDIFLDCQVWQLPDKLAEMAGWAPGPHNMPPPRVRRPSAGPAAPLQLLLRSAASGAYLTTEVLHLAHAHMASEAQVATAKVRATAPASALFEHHPGSGPSSVLLLTAELWQDTALLSSTPLVATTSALRTSSPQTGTLPLASNATNITNATNAGGAAAQPSCWWWGARAKEVAAAVADITALTQALSDDAAACLACVPAHKSFLQDLALWLAVVREEALSSGHCTSRCASAPAHCCNKQGTDSHAPGTAHNGGVGPKRQSAAAAAAASTAEGYAHHMHTPPPLPRHMQLQLAAGLLEHAAMIGMHGVHAMVSQQQRLLQQLHTQARPCADGHGAGSVTSPSPSHSLGASLLPSWLSPARLREVAWGHPCDVCEARYKQGLQVVVGNSRLYLSCAAAMLSTSAAARAVREGDWSFALVNVPWATVHLTLTALCLVCALSRTRAALAPGNSGARARAPVALRGYLVWVVLAWLYRVGCTWTLALIMAANQKPAVGSFMFGNLAAWCFALTINGFAEQLQAAAVLPASRVVQLTFGLDLPSALFWSGQELLGPMAAQVPRSTWAIVAFVRFVVAPLLLVVPRLVTDASLRYHILYARQPSSRQLPCTATTGHHPSGSKAAMRQSEGAPGSGAVRNRKQPADGAPSGSGSGRQLPAAEQAASSRPKQA